MDRHIKAHKFFNEYAYDHTVPWELPDEEAVVKPEKTVKSAEARRRIEALREIRESGLTIEEARELGLIH